MTRGGSRRLSSGSRTLTWPRPDPRGGSGFSRHADYWRLARDVIVDAIERDPTFLDVGCANGLLMESVAEWAAARGHRLEPYGLDLSPALADVAGTRLPRWPGRVWVCNALHWTPPRRFDYVSTELVYGPERRRRGLVEHLLTDVVAEDGRLVMCGYGSRRDLDIRAADVAVRLHRWGYPVAGGVAAVHPNGGVVTVSPGSTDRAGNSAHRRPDSHVS